MMKLAVAIIFFEKFEQTVECIDSVCNADCNVYVLNNNSSANSFNSLKNRFRSNTNVFFIHSDKNLGPAKGRNLLINFIKEEWIFFLDNDITVQNINWNSILNRYINNYIEFDAFIPRLYNVHEKNFSKFHIYTLADGKIEGIFESNHLTNWFPGGAACVNKLLFQKLGGYSEDITVLEDFELSIRALLRLTPIKALLIDDLTLFHYHRYSSKKEDQFAVQVRYKAEQYYLAERYIRDKYDVAFYSGWKPWVDEQLGLMVDKDDITVVKEKLILMLKYVKRKFFKAIFF